MDGLKLQVHEQLVGLDGVLIHVVLVKMMNEAVPKGGTAEAGRDCAHKQMEEQLLDGTVNFLSVQDEKA